MEIDNLVLIGTWIGAIMFGWAIRWIFWDLKNEKNKGRINEINERRTR